MTDALTLEARRAGALLDAPGPVSAPPAIVATGRLARYGGAEPRLRFTMPTEVAAAFDREGRGFSVERTGPRDWTIHPHDDARAKVKDRAFNATPRALWDGLPEFGSTDAEYACDGTAVLCHLPDGPLPPVNPAASAAANVARNRTRRPVARPTPAPLPNPPPAPNAAVAPPYAPAAASQPRPAPTAADARACLALLRRIEAETPYRLKKVASPNGTPRWVFDAGRIE